MKYLYNLLFSIAFIACGNSEPQNIPRSKTESLSDKIILTQAQFDGENMALGALAEYDFNETVKVNGMIDVPPQNKSSVTTFIGGYITRTPLLIGDRVKKGQLLVTLENTVFVELQQNYLEVSEQLNYLKSEFDRQKTLYDENITSEKNYLRAESIYKSNLANYNGLRKKLQMININPSSVEQGRITTSINLYANIDGYVTKVNVSNGTYVSPSDIIMEIVDTVHIHLELSVYEKDIMNIKKGQKILFKIPEASDNIFEAEVHLVGTTIDEKNRRVKVHGHVDNEDNSFIVGMFVEAEIIIKRSKGLGLPKDAVISTENSSYCLVLKGKKSSEFNFEKVKLEIGKQTEDHIEILNVKDLQKQQIVTKGTGMLLNKEEAE